MKVFDQEVHPDYRKSKGQSLKVLLGLILFTAMISQHHLDPSPLNLLRPTDGVSNWLGVPGALTAGFINDLLGWCGFLLPLSLLLLTHTEILNRRQIVLLDSTAIILIAVGMGQLFADVDYNPVSGLVGTISFRYFGQFPGKLITLLVVTGFLVRYAKHYQLNLHFLIMLSQMIGILAVGFRYFDGFLQKRFGKVIKTLKQQVSPFSDVFQQKLSNAKTGISQGWRVTVGKAGGWLLERNPFYRLPSDTKDLTVVGLTGDHAVRELKQRKLLSATVEELERRSLMEGN